MKDPVWKIFTFYLLLLGLVFSSSTAFSQISVVQYNADWNDANKVEWLKKLTDVDKVKNVCIDEDPKAQNKHSIVVVPTIVIFNNNEEVKRFQANIMMTMEATKSEVQNSIDEIVMEAF